jgi:ATP-dependent DNA helicase RecQ
MDADDPALVRARAEGHLRALVGREDASLYDDQWAAVEALVVHRRRALVVQRTGWGKSAVYFVATALLRAAGAGPTVIVSPLLALMRNQIAAAERAGIHAATINSTNIEDWQAIHERIAAGEVDVLLVSPERLNNPAFRDEVLPRLTEDVGLLVIDEAHCISDWGHDFRPDYRRIRQVLADLPAGIPVLATTATANARVTDDVAEQLGSDVLVLRGSLDRSSLHLGVVRLPRPEQRLAWLADHLDELPGSGIVYTLTVAASQEIADFLRTRGHAVAAYSGQTEASERLALEQDLLAGRLKALVATSALGMGFDATLGFVVNVGAPASPVAYYQQVGRAGRGTSEATVVLLPAREDRDIWAWFASLAFPPSTTSAPRSRCSPTAAGRCRRRPWRPTSTSTAPGSRRCSRCSTSTVPCAASRAAGPRPAPTGPTTRNATTGSRPPVARSRRRCWSTPPRRGAGCGSCASSSTTRRPPTAAAATTAVGSPCRRGSPTPPSPGPATG